MKKLSFILLSFCASTLIGQSSEEAAIRSAIEEAGNGVYANNYEKWAANWSEAEILFHYANEAEHYLFENWSKLAAQMKENMKGGPSEQLPYVERKNFKYKIDGNLAWVHFDQKDDNRESKEQRVLVKENGRWKIVNMTAVDVSSYEKNGPIRRLFHFSFKEGTAEEEILFVKNSFQGMVPKISGMNQAIWMKSTDKDPFYDYSLFLEFAHEKALKIYEDHPDHKAIPKRAQSHIAKWLSHTYQEK